MPLTHHGGTFSVTHSVAMGCGWRREIPLRINRNRLLHVATFFDHQRQELVLKREEKVSNAERC